MELFNTQFSISTLTLIVIGALFIIEQIFYRFLGSYPYRFGLLLKTITIYDLSISIQEKERKCINRLALKRNDSKKETYVRYRYPPTIIGPLLFVGQIKENEGKIMIRIGPISAIFILFLIILSIISNGFYGFLNVLIIVVPIVWLYLRFCSMIRSI